MRKLMFLLFGLSISCAASNSVGYIVDNRAIGTASYLETSGRGEITWTLLEEGSAFIRVLPQTERSAYLSDFKVNDRACRITDTWWSDYYTVYASSENADLDYFIIVEDAGECLVKKLP